MTGHKDVKLGGGASLTKDYEVLISFLGSNYDTKTEWRKEKGILPSSPKNTMSGKFGTFRSTKSNIKMSDMRQSFKHPNAS